MFTGRMGRISVFCSYAREDESIRASLERHLAPLRDEQIIDDWYDSRIQPGTRWDAEIQSALDRSRLMLFVVTPDLLASRYVSEVEIPKALDRERAGECRVVPIMARHSDWRGSPLAEFQALPGGGRWLDAAPDAEASYREIAAGIRDVCLRVVDWENPYKRSQVGDWTHQEQTITVADGQSATGEGTEELIGKTETEATLRVEILMNGEFREQTLTIDLTRPLEDRLGDLMRQGGTNLPANLEMSTGPAQYGEEHVTIGGRRYETVWARRDLTLAMRGHRQSGHATQWRSIDVPLFGLVKGEAELPGWRQYQVLLDSGHGDAAARKPRLAGAAAERTATGNLFSAPHPGRSDRATPPAAAMGPGRWLGQVNAFGTRTNFDLLLHPNGALQGQQNTLGVPSDLHGQWMFDPASSLLTIQLVTSMMGVPTSQDLVQVRITGGQGNMLQGQDGSGRLFVLQRVG